MQYNPYTEQVHRLTNELSEVQRQIEEHSEQLALHASFNIDEESRALGRFAIEASDLKVERMKNLTDAAEAKRRVEYLHALARPGYDPRYWFSVERAAYKKNLTSQSQALALLMHREKELDQSIRATDARFLDQERALDRYKTYDKAEAEAAVISLKAKKDTLQSALNHAQPLMDKVDRELAEPLMEYRALTTQMTQLQKQIRRAEALMSRLDAASAPRDRALLHEESRELLGDGSPAKARHTLQRQFDSIERNAKKMEKRLEELTRRATRDVKAVVIDGNNLCYESGNKFIGLAAVQATGKRLSRNYAVTIVFDSSIRRLAGTKDAGIKQHFGDEIEVHIVQEKADETILKLADDPKTYIVSNDRFAEFNDMPAVHEKRILPHEILNGIVFIHDLDVKERLQ
ncbi:hypothetical protein SB861_52275 [Paraburkholderia sp. SIMBA_049]